MVAGVRNQVVSNRLVVLEVLSEVGGDSDVDRRKDYLDVVPVPLVLARREIRRNGNEIYSGKQIKTEEQDV